MNRLAVSTAVGLGLIVCVAIDAAEGKRGGRDQGHADYATQKSDSLSVPAHPLDIVLGRPTTDCVTMSVLVYQDIDAQIAYGTQRGQFTRRLPSRRFAKGVPAEVMLSGLRPNTQYFYQFHGRNVPSIEGGFRTQRTPGSAFTFTITADSHLDERVSGPLYQRTLANAHADAPDFHVDLGDTFMTEKHDSREDAARQYLAQRFYFGLLCHSAPLFLVLGNHDGESPRGRGSDADALAVWSNLMRKRYFPNPVPDAFYTGDTAKHPEAGLLQDYYAWHWGDALFVVLDPFWFTQKQRGKSNNWKHTLGPEQYQWLARTLEASKARFKFVFIHHLVGGLDDQCRGGVEAAPFHEWGGKNADGSPGFAANRPGWPMPIHQLLVRHRVTAVFHGHDHLFAKQELDGIVYQEVPQPATPGSPKAPRFTEEYGYKSGVILGSPGHLRVRVNPSAVQVEYVRASEAEEERSDRRNAAVAQSYAIPTNPPPVR